MKIIAKSIRSFVCILINIYQFFLSPIFSFFGIHCRYLPTCSQYTKEAILEYGVLKGGIMGVKRFLRCNPFGGHGFDPVIKNKEQKDEEESK